MVTASEEADEGGGTDKHDEVKNLEVLGGDGARDGDGKREDDADVAFYWCGLA